MAAVALRAPLYGGCPYGQGRSRCPLRCILARVVPEPLLDHPPDFDEPFREPTHEEAAAIAAGALLTPQQELATALGLPLAVPLPLLAPGLSERQLMQQITATSSWQELEALLLRRVTPGAHQAVRAKLTRDTVGGAAAASADDTDGRGRADGVQQQPDLRQSPPSPADLAAPSATAGPPAAGSGDVQRPPRRRQAPQPLSVQPRPVVAAPGGGDDVDDDATKRPSGAAVALPLLPQQSAAAAAAPPLPLPLVNSLHTTEAVRRAAALLPAVLARADAPISERQRARELAALLSAQATALAGRGELDVRGAAHIAAGLARLGCCDAPLLVALQGVVLERLPELTGQHAALLLGALASTRTRPEPDLLPALQRQLLQRPQLFTQCSLPATIVALAKLLQASGGGSGSSGSGSGSMTATSTLQYEGDQDLIALLVARCSSQMPHWTPGHLAQATWGLARLGARIDPACMRTLLRVCGRRVRCMTPRDLAMVVSALPELNAMPTADWLAAFCTTAAAKTPHAGPLELHSILFGLAKMRRAERRGEAVPAPSCGGTVPGSGKPWPGSAPARLALLALLRRALVWLQRRQHEMTAQQLCGVLLALAELTPPGVLALAGELHRRGASASPLSAGDDTDNVMRISNISAAVMSELLPGWLDPEAVRTLARKAAWSAGQARQLDAAAAALRERFHAGA